MSNHKPVVLKPNGTEPVVGIVKQKFVDVDGRWIGWADLIVNKAGDTSDWHFHPSSETYVYVVRGSLTINFGPSGKESVVACSGDFLQIPSGTIHREVTSIESDLEAFVLRIGREPEKVTVECPS